MNTKFEPSDIYPNSMTTITLDGIKFHLLTKQEPTLLMDEISANAIAEEYSKNGYRLPTKADAQRLIKSGVLNEIGVIGVYVSEENSFAIGWIADGMAIVQSAEHPSTFSIQEDANYCFPVIPICLCQDVVTGTCNGEPTM